ncbi:putative alpha-N-acetylglucosaminidase [Tricladium varicosporioides]|nr:putative alpha-N-acetylglucosaminidase [Hymenoscyphus varicosporioides]
MRLLFSLSWSLTAFLTVTAQLTDSIEGIQGLVKRRLPDHVNDFEFVLTGNELKPITTAIRAVNDNYVILSTSSGRIRVEGNTPIALASGLHRYLTDVVHVDIFWYIGSRLNVSSSLPSLTTPLNGSSIVPWRYHFNTVTFSYTSPFWTWEDWELELDWLALRGVNLPLAWNGQEKILVEAFRDIGLTDAEINMYLSGPAFQAWNRFGNIQGSWGGDLPMEWIDDQFELQKNITKRMVELGMTPVLPCFTGFVPRAITRVIPNVTVVNGSQWEDFPVQYTNVTFLEPSDPNFSKLQNSFISKQAAAYGNITHFYTLDQYNENDPYLNSTGYLREISNNTMASLKSADPDAIWLMQGWLFFSNQDYWVRDNVEAYLGGVSDNNDMLILDLFSESSPQWSDPRVQSYHGKPWIWCQLHNYGGNMGLYGQIMNLTINPIQALVNESSGSLVGFGLTMEGQEGNEIVYDLLLDQAWSNSPIETDIYFSNWVTRRYAGTGALPNELYQAWDIMRTTVYNNTNLSKAPSVQKSIIELSPSINGLLNKTGRHGTTITYDPAILDQSWKLLFAAATPNPQLWNNPAFNYDMVDVTRQVLSNNFNALYANLISTYNSSNSSITQLNATITTMKSLLTTLNTVLAASPHFSFSAWLSSARSSAPSPATQTFFEFNAKNQITLWGPDGEISDYASKSWGGLVGEYYLPRWEIFGKYLTEVSAQEYNGTDLKKRLRNFELGWQSDRNSTASVWVEVLGVEESKISLESILRGVVERWG